MDFREIVTNLEQEHAARLEEVRQLQAVVKRWEGRLEEVRVHQETQAASTAFFEHYNQDYHVQPGHGVGETYYECNNIPLHHELLRALFVAWNRHKGA